MPHLDWPALVQEKMTDDDLAQQLPQKLQALVEFVVQPWPPPKQESVPPNPPAQVNAGSVARYGIQVQSTKKKRLFCVQCTLVQVNSVQPTVISR